MAHGAGKGKEKSNGKDSPAKEKSSSKRKAAPSAIVADALEEVSQLESALEDGPQAEGSQAPNDGSTSGSLPPGPQQLPGADTVAANVLRMRNERMEARLQEAMRQAEEMKQRLESMERQRAAEASFIPISFQTWKLICICYRRLPSLVPRTVILQKPLPTQSVAEVLRRLRTKKVLQFRTKTKRFILRS